MAAERFVTVGELKATPGNLVSDLIEDATMFGTTCYITEDGKAKVVLMDISRYNALMDLVEESEFPRHEDENSSKTREYASVRTILKSSTRVLRKD
jgi:hypothetical protein